MLSLYRLYTVKVKVNEEDTSVHRTENFVRRPTTSVKIAWKINQCTGSDAQSIVERLSFTGSE